MHENLKSDILKHAKLAFERSCTMSDTQRLEVYVYEGKVITSEVLSPEHSIPYTPQRILCYQVWGHDYLEGEIIAWIDQARQEMSPKPLEESIVDTLNAIAKGKGTHPDTISSVEVFAHLRMDQLEPMEHAIIEYWWDNKEVENAKSLALHQITEALEGREE